MRYRIHTTIRVAAAIVLMALAFAPTVPAAKPSRAWEVAHKSTYAVRDGHGSFQAKYQGWTTDDNDQFSGTIRFRFKTVDARSPFRLGFIGGRPPVSPPEYLDPASAGPVRVVETGTYPFEQPAPFTCRYERPRRRWRTFIGGETLYRRGRDRGIRISWVNPTLGAFDRCPGLYPRVLRSIDSNGILLDRATSTVVPVRRLLKRSSVYVLTGRARIRNNDYAGGGTADVRWTYRFRLVRKPGR